MSQSVGIAVVEDDPDLRALHRLRLSADYDVLTVADGKDAVGRIDDQQVLLLDRRLPGPDGDVISRRLRSRGYQGAIAMVTSDRPDPAIATLPIDEYVTKPVDRQEIRAVVGRLEVRLDIPREIRDLFAMVSRRGRLETTVDDSQLSACDGYRTLVRWIDRQYRRAIDDVTSPARIAALADDALAPAIDLGDTIDALAEPTRPVASSTGPGQEV